MCAARTREIPRPTKSFSDMTLTPSLFFVICSLTQSMKSVSVSLRLLSLRLEDYDPVVFVDSRMRFSNLLHGSGHAARQHHGNRHHHAGRENRVSAA